jgi:DNA polymerase III subunit gamma/tau
VGQALYRKYRSKKLSEIVGQEHITSTLERALKTGKISHAYLFTGPRGVGKTSIARILAHEINELPYTDESMHLDIIEIDAASNRRIDEIRDLREKVHIAPTSAKYKVYIIDEVHMLTKEAFNALLKTLEEPPAHVIFILATTEIHKLPETIISRTQRFTFKSVDEQDAVKHLRMIAETEGMKIEDDALQLLAEHSNGSFRDSISLLDQVGNSKTTVSRKDAERLVGLASSQHIGELENAVLNGLPADIVRVLEALVADGTNPSQAAKQLSASLRRRLIDEGNHNLTELLHDLLQVQTSQDPTALFEILLFKANLALDQEGKGSREKGEVKSKEIVSQKVNEQENIEIKNIETSLNPKPSTLNPQPLAIWWEDVLKHIKKVNNTLYGMLRMAEASVEESTLNLRFGFNFHSKKVADASTQATIREAIKAVTGQDYSVKAVHDATLGKQPKAKSAVEKPIVHQKEQNTELDSITNIFGGGEVLDS